jgi:hypothetical protein
VLDIKMKFVDTLFLLISCLASFSLALDKPARHVRGIETGEDRDLGFFATPQKRCENQVALCGLATGLTELPYAQWISALSLLDGSGNGIYSDIVSLISELSHVNASAIIDASVDAATSGLDDIQSALASLDTVSLESTDVAASQIQSIVQVIVNLIMKLTGVNLSFLTTIVDLVVKLVAAIPMGPAAIFQVVMSAIVQYILPLVTQFLAPPATTAALASCYSSLSDCQFVQFVAKVVPSLISGSMIAQAYNTTNSTTTP